MKKLFLIPVNAFLIACHGVSELNNKKVFIGIEFTAACGGVVQFVNYSRGFSQVKYYF